MSLPRRTTILILEDEPALQSVIAKLLAKTFHADFLKASTNEEALRTLETTSVDLIITDINHPGPSGLDFLKVLSASKRLRQIPVLVQSAQTAKADDELAVWRAGARGVLTKPYTASKLANEVEKLIGSIGDLDGALIELGSEGQAIDYKEVVKLESKTERASLAKDVIAMANTGGGTIIVGVAETTPGSFMPLGLAEPDRAPLETTRLNQALSSFVDPPIAIRSRQVHHQGGCFVFIEVPSAAPNVAMPRRDHPEAGLFTGRVYARTSAAQSAPLQSAGEIRALLDRMVDELARRHIKTGL